MKKENAVPILAGFVTLESMNKWLAEEDTPAGHVKNFQKGVNDHVTVMESILEEKYEPE